MVTIFAELNSLYMSWSIFITLFSTLREDVYVDNETIWEARTKALFLRRMFHSYKQAGITLDVIYIICKDT